MNHPFQICARCVCDTTIPSIRFNGKGICNLCENHDELVAEYAPGPKLDAKRDAFISKIKASGKGMRYDCVVGVSGGTDSTYTLYLTKKLELRPLAVHFDNGWNSDQSVSNIRAVTNKLGIDLETYVVDWEEFKDLQRSFLAASVPCIETPTDVAIHATLFRTAASEGIRYILGGQSFKTEGTVPREWSYIDGTYINTIQRRFGTKPIKSFPNLTLWDIFYYTFIKRIQSVPFLNYFDYSKAEAKAFLAKEFGWVDYGGHHYESLYSKFAFGWYLPRKFGIDKRKISLSGPVRSGQLSRTDALEMLHNEPPVDPKLVDYVAEKLGITRNEYDKMFGNEPKSYRNYFTSEDILKYFKLPILGLVRMGFFTPVLYKKYFE